MIALLLALLGFAVLDSLDVLLVGVTTAVVFDARLRRRSPVPGGLAFVAGVFLSTTTFGILTVLGIDWLTTWLDFELTAATRYRGELAIGLVLLVLALIPARNQKAPPWAEKLRSKPAVLGAAGAVIGIIQAPTALPYLAGLAMIAAQHPLPAAWPVIVVVYCAIALIPPLLVLALATRNSRRSRRRYLRIVRLLTRWGPLAVRVIFFVVGAGLVVDALIHHSDVF
ncbi:hypothetical protein DW322_10115 [Rhodococcus rhodnii]|uniref:Sap-like sulfolipid-1-addressing protein n=2 Tax=Rhodococcus rhodnii TaxID=38312 RepID=R7WJI6_9NOCA|nr:GAP family protein [Rhodococcus rhodnii]EOM75466.1 hypothetical protein Rrhod_3264 [Rhodococcus rhodnii LMG 5362]TXG92577.1 hypothetical protein DW322_10115 [Rhodococcus rhodnii]